MTAAPEGRTFRNPVYRNVFADPFVLKFNGAYYAYGTPTPGKALTVLRSTDLVTWTPAGEILAPPGPGLAHWAPEVAYDNGRFFLYHSTGGVEGEGHQLRVAAGDSPRGPFDEDLGLLAADDPFTIDAHPFLDEDGRWYLFYSRDFLDGDRVGTGIVVDRLADMARLSGQTTTVMRPHADWHLFERQRRWYQRVWDWYTVEGPFVRKHEGRYWCFYSGGAWKADNYGISSAVADDPLGTFTTVEDGDTADVLRTIPGHVIGPGHGSVAVAPDNTTEYVVYHAWDVDQTGRYMRADQLLWVDGRPRSRGPEEEPQPYPPEPLFRDLFDEDRGDLDPAHWDVRGAWDRIRRALVPTAASNGARAVLRLAAPPAYLLEANVLPGDAELPSSAGVLTRYRDDDDYTAVLIRPHRGCLVARTVRAGRVDDSVLGRLRPDFRAGAYHQLLLRRDGHTVRVRLDGVTFGSLSADRADHGAVGLLALEQPAAFAGVALTACPSSP